MTSLKSALRAGIVAITLAGTAMTGGAAFAQGPGGPGFPGGPGGPGGPGPGPGPGPRPPFTLEFNIGGDRCVSDSRIIREVRDEGYRNVRIVRKTRSDVYLVGSRGSRWYEIRVDRCSGEIERERRVTRRSNGGFSFSFGFAF